MGNGPEIAVAYLACFYMGAAAAPLGLRLKQIELEDIVSRLQPKAYIGDGHRLEPLALYLERNVAVRRRFVVGETTLISTASWTSLAEHEPLLGLYPESRPLKSSR
jgi:acyl-CoA synthetase (AMP-forming)/AMP-acid ligase II